MMALWIAAGAAYLFVGIGAAAQVFEHGHSGGRAFFGGILWPATAMFLFGMWLIKTLDS